MLSTTALSLVMPLAMPACARGDMITGKLRGQWGFKGYVTSDCGAVECLGPSCDAGKFHVARRVCLWTFCV